MSDTPKTDQAKIAAGFQAVPESFLVFARKLERENAALKAYADKLADGLPCLPKDVENLRTANAEFAAENAALRAAIKNIALLTANGEAERANWVALGILNDPRAALDAARKETK